MQASGPRTGFGGPGPQLIFKTFSFNNLRRNSESLWDPASMSTCLIIFEGFKIKLFELSDRPTLSIVKCCTITFSWFKTPFCISHVCYSHQSLLKVTFCLWCIYFSKIFCLAEPIAIIRMCKEIWNFRLAEAASFGRANFFRLSCKLLHDLFIFLLEIELK